MRKPGRSLTIPHQSNVINPSLDRQKRASLAEIAPAPPPPPRPPTPGSETRAVLSIFPDVESRPAKAPLSKLARKQGGEKFHGPGLSFKPLGAGLTGTQRCRCRHC
jgi:hypothetical protein